MHFAANFFFISLSFSFVVFVGLCIIDTFNVFYYRDIAEDNPDKDVWMKKSNIALKVKHIINKAALSKAAKHRKHKQWLYFLGNHYIFDKQTINVDLYFKNTGLLLMFLTDCYSITSCFFSTKIPSRCYHFQTKFDMGSYLVRVWYFHCLFSFHFYTTYQWTFVNLISIKWEHIGNLL